MTQYNSLSVKLSNSQLKSGVRNETVVLRLSSNMIGDNESDFPHKLLLTRQVAKLFKAFANYSSRDMLSKTQLSKMIQSGGFLDRSLGPLLKTGLPSKKM